MKTKPTLLAIALACAFPGVMAQTNADMQREIDQLKAQLRALMEKVEAMSQKGGVDPQEFNRLVQKVDLAEENSITSGLQGIKFKGVIEARFLHDKNNDPALAVQGFGAGNGYAGTGMFEISKETEDGKGIKWMLRLTPGGANVQGDALVHEASVSIPLYDKTRLIAGLVPDWQGYEYWSDQGDKAPELLIHRAEAAKAEGLNAGEQEVVFCPELCSGQQGKAIGKPRRGSLRNSRC